MSTVRTPGPWTPAKSFSGCKRDPLDPAKPYHLFRVIGYRHGLRIIEKKRDEQGRALWFATEQDALSAA